jgi:Spy/CpxP family protein refolding chaperone
MKICTPTSFAWLALAGLLMTADVLAKPQDRDWPSWRQGPPGAEQQLAHLDQALELTDEQAVRLLEVLQAAAAEREALHARAMEQMRPQICALIQGTEADILTVLTREQAVTFHELKADRRGRTAGRRGRGMALPDCQQDGG